MRARIEPFLKCLEMQAIVNKQAIVNNTSRIQLQNEGKSASEVIEGEDIEEEEELGLEKTNQSGKEI